MGQEGLGEDERPVAPDQLLRDLVDTRTAALQPNASAETTDMRALRKSLLVYSIYHVARIRGTTVSGNDASDRVNDGFAEIRKTEAVALQIAPVNGWVDQSAAVKGPVAIPHDMLDAINKLAKTQAVEKRAAPARTVMKAAKVTYIQMGHRGGVVKTDEHHLARRRGSPKLCQTEYAQTIPARQ